MRVRRRGPCPELPPSPCSEANAELLIRCSVNRVEKFGYPGEQKTDKDRGGAGGNEGSSLVQSRSHIYYYITIHQCWLGQFKYLQGTNQRASYFYGQTIGVVQAQKHSIQLKYICTKTQQIQRRTSVGTLCYYYHFSRGLVALSLFIRAKALHLVETKAQGGG